MYCNIPLQALPIGARLVSSIYDERRTKLLAAGMEITEQLLLTLRNRTIDSVVVGRQDLGRILAFKPQGKANVAPGERRNITTNIENPISRELDSQLGSCSQPGITASLRPFAAVLRPTELGSYDRDLMNFMAERREYNVDRLHQLGEACATGNPIDLELTFDVVRDQLRTATEDVDAFSCLGTTPFMHPYPTRHVLHTAMIATSIGIALGLDERNLEELGTGCLIHDLGMLGVDRMTVGAKTFLEPTEFAEIVKHPIRTFEMIERHIDLVPVGARMVAYQMHERCNGSGYPRGRTKAQIHPLARIAAVADSFSALVCARPHRPGMQPYFAMEKLVKDVSRGLFDPQAVRGLLQAVSLFPVGSYVEMSNGYVGRVIRANAHDYMRPVVEVWSRDRIGGAPAVVDLAQESKLAIRRTLDAPHSN